VINSEGPAPVYVGIYNQLGMQMTTCTNIGGNALTLDLAGFPAGLYMIDVKFSDGSRKTERLSVVKR
jgi:hypothetical protein